MDWKKFLLSFAGFIVIGVTGGFLYAVLVNGMIYFKLMPESIGGQGFAYALTVLASRVWMGAIALSFISLFIKQNWRIVLYTAPLYAPSLFAIVYTVINQDVSALPPVDAAQDLPAE